MKVGDLVTFEHEMDNSVSGIVVKVYLPPKSPAGYMWCDVLWNFMPHNAPCKQRLCELKVLNEAG